MERKKSLLEIKPCLCYVVPKTSANKENAKSENTGRGKGGKTILTSGIFGGKAPTPKGVKQ